MKTINKSFRTRFLVVLVSVLIALVVVEIGLRLAGFTYFNPYRADSDLGFTLRPNAEGWWTREGRAYIKINSQGLRDVEHSLAKPAGTIRIAVLGDSFAEALQVPIEQTFWSVMQRQLETAVAGGKKVEVLNFGVSGFSTARELIMLRQRVWQYNPDLVLLLFTPGNDVKDNSRALTGYSEPLPYFVIQNGSLVLDDSALREREKHALFRLQRSVVGDAWDWIRARSRVLGLVYTVRESYFSQGRPSRLDGERGIDGNVFRVPVDADWSDAWLVTEKLIITMRNEVEAHGAKFLVVTGSNGIQVDPNEGVRNEYMKTLGVSNLFYPEERLKILGEREQIDVLNLAPLFLEVTKRDQLQLHGFGDSKGRGHWNEQGHRLAAEMISARLRQRLN
jgi:lysophospholipase L1-like esterase